ncbi:MAG: PA2169 family four-helix-bundle protein [Ferruginibacter sp.]
MTNEAITKNDPAIEVLNDLIQINNDRIEGYDNAIENLKDSDIDLQTVFNRLKANSVKNIQELNAKVNELGGEPVTDTTLLGKIYRGWMDVKSAFTGHDRDGIINDCQGGEKAAQEAYDKALKDDGNLTMETRVLLISQQTGLLADKQAVDNFN